MHSDRRAPVRTDRLDVTAGSEVEVLVLERDRLEAACSRGISWATALQRIIASHLVRQLRTALARLESLAGQEDAESEAEGRKHSDVATPKSLNIDFSAPPTGRARVQRVRAVNTESGPVAGSEQAAGAEPEFEAWEDLPPAIDPTREELYELLQATEAGLGGGTDYQLQTVRVVIDEDAWGRRAL